MKSKEVLEDLKAEGKSSEIKCITQHPGFNPVCLQKWALKLTEIQPSGNREQVRLIARSQKISTQLRFKSCLNYVMFTEKMLLFIGGFWYSLVLFHI